MLQTLFTVDPALGRIHKDTLSDQTLMEILIAGMDDCIKFLYQDDNGNFTDFQQWNEVYHWGGRVTGIGFTKRLYDTEQFPFAFIPPFVTDFKMYSCNLHGTLQTSALPANIEHFKVQGNKLHGSLDFQGFPRKLLIINIRSNQFSGSCALEDLPNELTIFNAKDNDFSGEIDLNSLPDDLQLLLLQKNKLTGSVNIARLPRIICGIDLSNNALSGDFRLMVFPESLDYINVESNLLSQTFTLRAASCELSFNLIFRGLAAVVDENGNEHNWMKRILEKNGEVKR